MSVSHNHCLFSTLGECGEHLVLTPLSDLRFSSIDKTCFPGAKTVIEVLLLRADMFYQHRISLDQSFICSMHKKKFLEQFWISKHKKCVLCIPCFKRPVSYTADRNINTTQAIVAFENFGTSHSYGKPICRNCRGDIAELVDEVSDDE